MPRPKWLLQGCEDAWNACFAEPECLLLFQCLQGCAPLDLVCQQTCYQDHGGGTLPLQDLLQCSATSCSNDCK